MEHGANTVEQGHCSQIVGGALVVQLCEVSRATRSVLNRNVAAARRFERLDEREHRGRVARAKVEVLGHGRVLSERGKVAESSDVAVGKVDDVDVVSLTRAVRGGVVGAKDGEVGSHLGGHLRNVSAAVPCILRLAHVVR